MPKIKTSKHKLNDLNKVKSDNLICFIAECRRVLQTYIDYLWKNKVVWGNEPANTWDIKTNKFNLPKYFPNKVIIDSPLSARVMKCLTNQALGMVKGAVKQQSKRFYVLRKKLETKDLISAWLVNKIRKNKPIKPMALKSKIELCSICADLIDTDGHWDMFLQLKSIGKTYGKIRIPLNSHRQSKSLLAKGTRLNSFLIDEDSIDIRYSLANKHKTEGLTLGADQGKLDILTLSNGQTTPNCCLHGHTLSSIIDKMSRKKKGSKAFHKAQSHRKNFIHWSINQLNFRGVKQLNLEKIENIFYRRKTNRKMSHWTNSIIRDKVKDYCSDQEVLVVEQSSAYMSQRCSSCGLVRKANRKGKQYTCKGCEVSLDADLNAARNHEQDLQYPSWALRKYIQENRFNLGNGFYWNIGEAPTVPLSENYLCYNLL